jgi:hypothetical protein
MEDIRLTLEALDINNITPLQALDSLSALKARLKE